MCIESTPLHEVDQEQFRQRMEKMAATTELKALAPVSFFEVKGQKIARADFDRTAGALHYFVSYLQTVERLASTHRHHGGIPGAAQQIADTLQSCEFNESE